MRMPGAVSRIAIVVVGVFCTWLTAGRATLNGIEGPNNGWLCILLAGLALLWARRTDSSREVAGRRLVAHDDLRGGRARAGQPRVPGASPSPTRENRRRDHLDTRAQAALMITAAKVGALLGRTRASRRATEATLDAYRDARIEGLRSARAILALLHVVALYLAQRIPATQPGHEKE